MTEWLHSDLDYKNLDWQAWLGKFYEDAEWLQQSVRAANTSWAARYGCPAVFLVETPDIRLPDSPLPLLPGWLDYNQRLAEFLLSKKETRPHIFDTGNFPGVGPPFTSLFRVTLGF